MRLTPPEVEFVEKIAQAQLRYKAIVTEQVNVLRTDEAEFERARTQLLQSSFVAKRG